MRPTPEEVLLSINRDFDENIRPDPASPLAVSLSLTMSNLLRHVQLRIEREEGLIEEDAADLRRILGQAREFLASGATPASAKRAEAIAAVLDAPLAASLPSMAAARDRWVALRFQLAGAIDDLIAARDRYRDDQAYQALRRGIRAYLDRSLTREERLITEAFTLARR